MRYGPGINSSTLSDSSLTESAQPPHLQRETNTGSSFIPFCAYKTNMAISEPEVWLPNISFPICTSFKPTILEGQLCYKIQVNATGSLGKKNGLSLLLDYQDPLSLQASSKQEWKDDNSRIRQVNFDTMAKSLDIEAAKVHINTLSPFTGFGGGSYQMSVVKRMTGTEDFLAMPLKDRNCKVEQYESCRTRRLLEECQCVPGEIPTYQVRKFAIMKPYNFSAEFGEMQPKRQGLH